MLSDSSLLRQRFSVCGIPMVKFQCNKSRYSMGITVASKPLAVSRTFVSSRFISFLL
jgi:hypothetical protein